MPLLSVEGLQVTVRLPAVAPVTWTFVGTLGGCPST